jgi:hypothetical protein
MNGQRITTACTRPPTRCLSCFGNDPGRQVMPGVSCLRVMENLIPWVGVIAALTGAIVGGGIATVISCLQLREQRLRERNKLILSKLEEIHEVLSQFREAYRGSIHERLLTAHDAAEPNQIEKSLSKVPIEKLQMLVGFYAPELKDYLHLVENARKQYGGVLIKSMGLQRRDESARKEALGALFGAEGDVSKACIDMQVEAIELSKKYL